MEDISVQKTLATSLDLQDHATPSRKRPRSSADSEADSPTDAIHESPPSSPLLFEKKDELLWFEDGNIILVADRGGFRLYRGVLSARSAVFRDLFCVPQPGDAEIYEGCPVVRLHDKQDELWYLLRVLFGYTKFPQTEHIEFRQLAALVRLSHKYDINDLFDSSSERLLEMFPTQLADFERMQTLCSWSDAIEAINLAPLMNADFILPVAFYLCCQGPPQQFSRAAAGKGGPRVLDAEDREKCIELRAWLILTNYRLSLKLFDWTPLNNCYREKNCTKLLQKCMRLLAAIDENPTDCALFLSKRGLWEKLHLCDICREVLRVRDVTERQKLWQQLPSVLGMTIADWS
ncbi:hypothetical protein OBBRIDRAFT_390244 [Obba rivulosa]|uniref:BTB domain-containing protein n=1 Tax=Obba rivulosa TaxID=1052685 RepID=A0A8E2DG94_9APHY|nr:hypothetical protein OBBRIDRAFT_390244 [Obba rivulosa]